MEYQKLFKTMIRSTFQGMYWRAHETATLTSFERTVPRIFRPSYGPDVYITSFLMIVQQIHLVDQKICITG